MKTYKTTNLLIKKPISIILLLLGFNSIHIHSQQVERLNCIVELNIGESSKVRLINGETVLLTLEDVKVERDEVRGAVRSALVKISVDGEEATIGSGNYNLPIQLGKIKIDCPAIKEYSASGYYRFEGVMTKDARFRLWPKESPLIQPETFGFPLKQKWFASRMQSQNEMAGLGWAEKIKSTSFGYHATHDFGGAEGLDEVIAATNGLVVSSNNEILEGYEDLPGDVRMDVVWVVDSRNWYYRYSHLNSIEKEIVPGARIKLGQKIGYMGKQGGSGGWVHLHFGVHYKDNTTSKWIVEDAYAYLLEAYRIKYNPKIIAVARPKLIAWTNQKVKIDGSKSRSAEGEIVSFEWFFNDGSKANGPIQEKKYSKAGEYSEILKVTDSKGNASYDFQYIQIFDKDFPERQIPTIHPVYHPTQNIKVNEPVTFLVRTFGSKTGDETWNFGDGTKEVVVSSGIVHPITQNKEKYAEIVHSFSKPGIYIVRVKRTNEFGYSAIGHVYVEVE
ncbi:MAG: PKD domain-containing protein [Parabacteroides sp.]|nr:PKD domain-containing protein [Parabacteroides sp.]